MWSDLSTAPPSIQFSSPASAPSFRRSRRRQPAWERRRRGALIEQVDNARVTSIEVVRHRPCRVMAFEATAGKLLPEAYAVKRFDGQVALVTGAARGQGRSHAVALAHEGADIIAIDIGRQMPTVPYPMATPDDLAVTIRQVEALGRRIVAVESDVRDPAVLGAAVDDAVSRLGRLDVVCVNAGIVTLADEQLAVQLWRDVIDVNLSGAWYTCFVTIPHLSAGGSIIITSSVAGLKGVSHAAHYSAAKHGLIGMARSLARELSERRIRVNVICPATTLTPMIDNPWMISKFRPDLEDPQLADVGAVMLARGGIQEPWIEASDVTNAVLFLASEQARYVTGIAIPIDLGETA